VDDKTWWLVNDVNGRLFKVEGSSTASALAAARKAAVGDHSRTDASVERLELDVVAGSCTADEVDLAVKAYENHGDRGPVRRLACRYRCQRWRLNNNHKRALLRLVDRSDSGSLRVTYPHAVYPALARRDLVRKGDDGWLLTAAGREIVEYLLDEQGDRIPTRGDTPQLYVIVHNRRRTARDPGRPQIHDVNPDSSRADIIERVNDLRANARRWGRDHDTYQVARLVFETEGR
jgi:hypothetical protein